MVGIVPNAVDVLADAKQAQVDTIDLEILELGADPQGVVSGCAVTAQASPNMTVAVAAGYVFTQSKQQAVTSGNVTIGTADATNPRFDLVVVDASGTKVVRAGTAAATPVFPALTLGDVVLASVLVLANDTTMETDKITDKRIFVTARKVSNANVSQSIVNTAAETTFNQGITIPANSMRTGSNIRFRAWGRFTTATTPPTMTIRAKWGSTTLAATAAITPPASLSDLQWFVEGDISFVSLGSSGTAEIQALFTWALTTTTSQSAQMRNTAVVTLNTTVDNILAISWQWGTAVATNPNVTQRMIVAQIT